jgi:hypothetical protein
MSGPILLSLFESAPMIAVAIGAVVTACVFWRRAPLSSVLVILGCILSVALLVSYPFAYKAVVHVWATDDQSLARINLAFSFGWSFFRAIYLILLVVAVYAGRKLA